MKLMDLVSSISNLSDEELLGLVHELGRRRKQYKPRASSKRRSKAYMDAVRLINQLSDEDAAKLLATLEGSNEPQAAS